MKVRYFSLLILFIFLSCSKEKRSDKAFGNMQDFVIHISNYAHELNSDFIIIPQNGIELAFNDQDPANGLNLAYLNAIDGVGVEELFYNGDYALDAERLSMLQQVKQSKKVLVSEYVNNDAFISDAYIQNEVKSFICFTRTSQNYDYIQIPDTIPNENNLNIMQLSQAQNYLYLIGPDETQFPSKEAYIASISSTNYDVILIDLFFNDEELSATDINQLKTKANGGSRLVISYINIGAAEKDRYYWKSGWRLLHPLLIKRKYEGYDREYWVRFWKSNWQEIIYGNDDSYMKKILNAGFDGAYLDNVEAYYFLYYKD